MREQSHKGSYVAPDIWKLAASFVKTSFRGDPALDKMLGYIRSRNIAGLLNYVDSLLEYNIPVARFRALRQLSAFFSKNADLSNSATTHDAAIATFMRGERICRITNRRLRHYASTGRVLGSFSDIESYLPGLKVAISKILGSTERFLDSVPSTLRVTSGATQDRSKRKTQPFIKVTNRIRLPSYSYPFVDALSKYHGINLKTTFVAYNRLTTVPKNYKTDRTIAAEPTGLLPFQLSFDSYVKERLKRSVGIDLEHGQAVHRKAARDASVSGDFATIDLSMASDTLAFSVVETLFPRSWFDILRRLRCTHYEYRGERGLYSKFSSMGNGVTFGLETLLFTAAAIAVGSKSYLVYGDDIIVETDLAAPLIRLLSFLGFHHNPDKTFLDGPFRESCGGDYYSGVDVRPFYVKTLNDRRSVILLVNSLLQRTDPFSQFWDYLFSLVADYRLPFGPVSDDLGACIHVDAYTAHTQGLIKRSGWIFYHKGVQNVPIVQKRWTKGWSRALFDTFRYNYWILEANRTDSVVNPTPPAIRGYRENLGMMRWNPSLASPHPHTYHVWEAWLARKG